MNNLITTLEERCLNLDLARIKVEKMKEKIEKYSKDTLCFLQDNLNQNYNTDTGEGRDYIKFKDNKLILRYRVYSSGLGERVWETRKIDGMCYESIEKYIKIILSDIQNKED